MSDQKTKHKKVLSKCEILSVHRLYTDDWTHRRRAWRHVILPMEEEKKGKKNLTHARIRIEAEGKKNKQERVLENHWPCEWSCIINLNSCSHDTAFSFCLSPSLFLALFLSFCLSFSMSLSFSILFLCLPLCLWFRKQGVWLFYHFSSHKNHYCSSCYVMTYRFCVWLPSFSLQQPIRWLIA